MKSISDSPCYVLELLLSLAVTGKLLYIAGHKIWRLWPHPTASRG